MKRILQLAVFLAVWASNSASACDICGNFMGLTPYNNRNSITLLHRYRVFNGYRNYQEERLFFPPAAYRTMHLQHDSVPEALRVHSSKDFESYKVFELRLKYFIHRRVELNLFAPILDNKSKTDGDYEHHTGFGDISFNIGFHLIQPKEDEGLKHKLVAGIGIKAPTGNYYAHGSASQRLPFEMQPGTGSTDGFAYLNYILVYQKVGINASGNFKLNGKNRYGERVGNSTTDFVSLFCRLRMGDLFLYPSAQANYEYTKGIYVKGVAQPSTLMNVLMCGPGLDVYYRSFSLNASWQFTVLESVQPGDLQSAGRLSLGLNYNFGGKGN